MAEAASALEMRAVGAGEKTSLLGRLLPEVAALGFAGGLPLLFFWRLLTPRLADRAHILWGDFAAQYYPLRLFVSRELAQGRLPLWNPYLNGGQPALADSQSAVFYLPNLALALLAPNGELPLEWMELYVVGHFVLAGIFTYLFARYVFRVYGTRVATLSALVVACAFTFGGYLTSFPMQQLSILEASVWLPLLLLLLDLARDRRSFRMYALASLPLAMSWTAGHGQTTMYVVYVAGAYTGARIALSWRTKADYKAILGLGLSLVLGTSLAAVQLLPTFEFLSLSTRTDLSYADTSFGLPPKELLGLLLPNVVGGPTLYVGVVGFALGLLAIVADGRRSRVRLWLGLATVSVLIALGGNTFLYSVLYIFVPGFSSVRDQERIVYAFSFFASMLAGQGLAALLSSRAPDLHCRLRPIRQLLLLTALACLALVVALSLFAPSGPESGNAIGRFSTALVVLLLAAGLFRLCEVGAVGVRLGGVMFLSLLLLDLFTANWAGNLAAAKDYAGYVPNKITQALEKASARYGGWRLSSEGLLPGGGSASSVWQWRDLVANTPFQLQTYAQVAANVEELQRTRLLSVGYWLTKRRLTDKRFQQVAAEGDSRLYEVGPELRLPRAYIAHRSVVLPEADALNALSSIDLSRLAILTPVAAGSSVPNKPNSPPDGGPPMGRDEEASVVVDTPSYQEVSARLSEPGVLVLSESYYPGWRAAVDGRDVPLWRAQYLLRGVELEGGEHRVVFSYEPHSLRLGAVVSILSAVVLLVLICANLLLARFHRRPGPSHGA